MSYSSNVRVIPTHQNVFGEPGMKLSEIIESLKDFHSTTIHIQCAKLAMYLQTDEGKESVGHIKLLVHFLFDEAKQNLRAFLLEDDERTVDTNILHKAPLLIISKLNLENNTEEGLNIEDAETREKFIRIYFSVCDLWLETSRLDRLDRAGVKKFKESFRAYQARQFLQSNDNEPLINLVARGRYLVEEVSKNTRLNFKKHFRDATGVELNLYLDFLFMMTPHWLVNVELDKVDEQVIRNLDEYHKHLNINKKKILKLLDTLAVNRDEFPKLRDNLLEMVGMSGKDQFSNLLPFISKPLLRFDDNFVCLSPDFLRLKFTEGAYNIVREQIKGTDVEGLLPELWGKAYEKYVLERLDSAFGKRVKSNIKDRSNREALDVLIDFDEVVFLCEIKYPHWSYKARLTGMRREFRPYIDKIAKFYTKKRRKTHTIKGLGQIKMFILKYRKGEINLDINLANKLLVPVLILGEEFPADPINMEYLKSNVSSRKCLLNDEQVSSFIQLNSEEIEMMESLMESKGYKDTKDILLNYALSFHKQVEPPEYVKRRTSFKHDIIARNIPINSKYLKAQLDRYSRPMKMYFKLSKNK